MLVKPISTPPVQDSAERVLVPFGPHSAALAVQKPPRLNFASVCLYCMTRWCESERCKAAHERSLWIVCEECDGFDAACERCIGGVVEADREDFDAQMFRPLPLTAPDNESGEYVYYVAPAASKHGFVHVPDFVYVDSAAPEANRRARV